jgi:acetamidase/formamidase
MEEAAMGMINLLVEKRKLTRLDAYGLTSIAGDCRLGATSEAEKNVHCLTPKSLWQAPR